MKQIKPSLQCFGVLLILFAAATSALPIDEAPKSSDVELISADELKSKFRAKELLLIVDVRSSESFANSTAMIRGAIHVNVRKLKYRLGFPPLKDIPKDREVITYCACPSEEASLLAAQILKESGFKRVRALKGGWSEWQKANGPMEPRQRG